MTPPAPPVVSLEHLHASTVTVREQAELVVERLKRSGTLTFRALTGDADKLTTVVRFLALLELFRNRAVVFEQLTPLGELTIRWIGDDGDALSITDEFDGGTAGEEPELDLEPGGAGNTHPDRATTPAQDDEELR